MTSLKLFTAILLLAFTASYCCKSKTVGGSLAFEMVSSSDFQIEPSFMTVSESDTLNLFCMVNKYYDSCSLKHKENTCKIEWEKLSGHEDGETRRWKMKCDDFEKRATFSLIRTNFFSCAIELHNVTSEGNHICNNIFISGANKCQ